LKINIIEPQVGVETAPRVRTSPDLGLARGLAQFAGGLQDVGESLSQAGKLQLAIDQRKRTWEVETETLSKLTEFRTRLDDIERELEQTPPEKNGEIHKNWKTAADQLKNQFGSEIMASASPYKSDVYELFNKNITAHLGQAEIKANRLANNKWIDNERAKIDQIGTYVVDTANPELIKPWSEIARRGRDEGIISAQEFERSFQHIKNGVDVNLRRIREEARRQQEKAAETRADADLNFRFPDDYDSQIKALGDPKQYEPLGLTAERASNLSNIIKARRSQETEKKTEVYHQTAVSLLQRLREDNLSNDMVDEAVSLDRLDLVTGDSVKKAIENKYAEEKVKTDPEVFARLLSLAHTSPDRPAVKSAILKNVNSLEEADVEKLLTLAESTYQAVENKRIAQGLEYIRNTVIPKRGLMEKFVSTPEEEEDLKKALSDFDSRITTMRTSGKELKMEDIDKAAEETSQTYRKTIWERTQRMMESLKTQMKPPKKETKEAYEVNKIYTDAQGRKAKYLGKGKWELQP
jgi:hypothetical protein